MEGGRKEGRSEKERPEQNYYTIFNSFTDPRALKKKKKKKKGSRITSILSIPAFCLAVILSCPGYPLIFFLLVHSKA